MAFPLKSKYTTPLLHGIIWCGIMVLPFIIRSPDGNVFPPAFTLIANIIHLGLFYFNALYLFPKLMNRKWWWLYIISAFVLIASIFQIKSLLLRLLAPPEVVVLEYTNALIGSPIILFFIVSIIYRIVADRINYEKRLKEREAEQLSTELKFLRSQISPHFLFNVLNNMVSMARHKSDRLEPSLIRLAGLMRYMLYESEARKVPLAHEIDYLKSYIELQKMRFEDHVKVTTDIDYEDHSETIEPMLLIPFVENAFKHGVTWVDQPFIHIELHVKKAALHFSVKNKFSMDEELSKDKDSGIGLANIQTRLQLLYPGKYKLTINNSDGIFYTHLILPLT
ncbi:histidine kinase [Sinomicrobium sp. FJxs]|uniref:Histidine kinase n=2 Tax=Sinomicrobium weinanense TaxID=2842200 RepID=A0A926JS74_9FLAO|nr:histidine kinase [Sinomicrobium weinanense]